MNFLRRNIKAAAGAELVLGLGLLLVPSMIASLVAAVLIADGVLTLAVIWRRS
jgi:hypothetical protein